jgi:hypothetical protein
LGEPLRASRSRRAIRSITRAAATRRAGGSATIPLAETPNSYNYYIKKLRILYFIWLARRTINYSSIIFLGFNNKF